MLKNKKSAKKKLETDNNSSKKIEEDDFQLPEKNTPPSASNIKVNVDSNIKDLRELIEKNLKWSQIIYEQNKKIKRKLTWMTVWSYVRLAIIVIPVVLGIIYLPTLIDKIVDQYSSALGINFSGSSNIQELIEQLGGGQK